MKFQIVDKNGEDVGMPYATKALGVAALRRFRVHYPKESRGARLVPVNPSLTARKSAAVIRVYQLAAETYKAARALAAKGDRKGATALYLKADRLLKRASESGQHSEGPVGLLPNPRSKTVHWVIQFQERGRWVDYETTDSNTSATAKLRVRRNQKRNLKWRAIRRDRYAHENPQFDIDDDDLEDSMLAGTSAARALGRTAREHREKIKRYEISWYAPGRGCRVTGTRAIEALTKAQAISEVKARVKGKEFKDYKGATNFVAREVNPRSVKVRQFKPGDVVSLTMRYGALFTLDNPYDVIEVDGRGAKQRIKIASANDPRKAGWTDPQYLTILSGVNPGAVSAVSGSKAGRARRVNSTSTRTEVRSPTSTSTEVRSPTRTSTHANTRGNITVTGGAGAGATTSVTVRRNPATFLASDNSRTCYHCGKRIRKGSLLTAGPDRMPYHGKCYRQAEKDAALALQKRNPLSLRQKLVHAVTVYDQKQSKKPHYNMHALPQYLARIDEVVSDIEAGNSANDAISRGFSGALRNALLRAAGAGKASAAHDGAWYYAPGKKRNPSVKELAETFTGKVDGNVDSFKAANSAPSDLARIGKLVFIKLTGRRAQLTAPGAMVAVDTKGKLWIVSNRTPLFNRKAKPGEALDFGDVSQICYETKKRQDSFKGSEYVHSFGEEGGRKPRLLIDSEGMPILRGGDYQIKSEGIVN